MTPPARFLVAFSLLVPACAMDVGDPEEAAELEEMYQTISWCDDHPLAAPDNFFRSLRNAAEYMPGIPDRWGDRSGAQARCMSKIACRESDWRVHATNGSYRGMYQINRDYFPMGEATFAKYWDGGRDRNGVWRSARFWQHYAAFRYILSRPDYDNPCDGWASEQTRGWW